MPSELRKLKDQERLQRTRRRLLDAAAKAFADNGYHKCLISDIVSRAEVGQGTFYRHFESKTVIFEALFDRLMGQLLAEFGPMSDQLPEDSRSYSDASRAVVGRLVGVVQANRDLMHLFLREGRSVGPDFENMLTGQYDRFAELARFYLDHAIERGFARPCRSELVAQALVGMGLRMLDMWLGGRLPEQDLDRVIDELVDFAFLGFGNSKGENNG